MCASRALRRVAPDRSWDDPALLAGASEVGSGFRTLFNVPESIALLGGDDSAESYWRLALRHGLEGNLPALLDEQVHVLLELEGLGDHKPTERVRGISKVLHASLSVRTSQISVDEIDLDSTPGRLKVDSFRLRCRYALRFGELKDEQAEARIEVVRAAFQLTVPPVRPGLDVFSRLDFHVWCHAVVHWNLPTNPVDLEQREGRTHRYKGHAVRRNIAKVLGIEVLRERWMAGPTRGRSSSRRRAKAAPATSSPTGSTRRKAARRSSAACLSSPSAGRQVFSSASSVAWHSTVSSSANPARRTSWPTWGRAFTEEQIDHAVKEWRIDLTPPPRRDLTPLA